jgi:hypothetical protein
MSTKPKAKKRVLPKAAKRQSFKQALASTNKQYGDTLAKLAK